MNFVLHERRVDLIVKKWRGEEEEMAGRSAENEHYLQPLSPILQHLVTF